MAHSGFRIRRGDFLERYLEEGFGRFQHASKNAFEIEKREEILFRNASGKRIELKSRIVRDVPSFDAVESGERP